MMFKVLLPIAAFGLFGYAVTHLPSLKREQRLLAPPVEPAISPFESCVAGAGIVEAQTHNIEVGSPYPGIVAEVFVEDGHNVQKDTPLLRLDDRAAQAELRVRRANVVSARAFLKRLEGEPHAAVPHVPEAPAIQPQASPIPPELTQDIVLEALKLFARGGSDSRPVNPLMPPAAGRADPADGMAQGLKLAEHAIGLLKSTSAEADRELARAAIEQAEALLSQTETEISRLTIRSNISGQVLRVNIRPGEYVSLPSREPLMVLGNIDRLHVRMDIDEHDIPRFMLGAAAVAVPRGRPRDYVPLEFVRIQPFVIPKRSLTGGDTERLDTRVLQVIYEVKNYSRSSLLYVGQQVDVFVQSTPTPVEMEP